MDKKKILLLFPDGVGIRNYLYSNVFQNTKDDLVLLHNFDPETVAALKESIVLSETIFIPVYKESVKEKFLRELVCLARLYHNSKIVQNPSLLANWNWNHKILSKKVFYKTIESVAPFIKKYNSILKLEKQYQKAIRKNPFYFEIKSMLNKVQPNTVFCSHQRGLKAATVFAAAQDLGIATTTVIYSWDNVPKARLALRADCYLVWSDYMKKEMEFYYPEIPSSAICITGTPQFEFYEDSKNILDKKLFYEKYKLDPDKKIICFSGDDVVTSPDDPSYLKDIAEELKTANLDSQYQILFRRCPVDFSGRYDAIVEEYKGIIKEVTPLWHVNSTQEWSAFYPSIEDVKLLVSTAYYSDVVVNVGSTMAFDFALFKKPCIYINYDQNNKTIPNWSVKTIYQFQHFKSMPNQKAVIWLNSKDEIIEKLLNSNFNDFNMGLWKDVVIGDFENASNKIRKTFQLK